MTSKQTRNLPLAAVMLVLGYEWLVSGLTKIVHGDFAGGLGAFLRDNDGSAASWYRHLLARVVLPHAHLAGTAIETAELTVGIVFCCTAVLLVVRPETAYRLRLGIAAVAVTGLVLALSFKLLGGGAFAAPVAADSFDEGIDLDTMMVLLQAVVALSLVRLSSRSAAAGMLAPR
jgi:thiosulfate dehydrogenase [quinone] large subunit